MPNVLELCKHDNSRATFPADMKQNNFQLTNSTRKQIIGSMTYKSQCVMHWNYTNHEVSRYHEVSSQCTMKSATPMHRNITKKVTPVVCLLL